MYLYEDKIILTFNYKDGSKTITLAEVEGSDLSVLGALDNDNPNSVPSGNGFGFLVHNPVQRMQAAMRRTAGRGKVISPLDYN